MRLLCHHCGFDRQGVNIYKSLTAYNGTHQFEFVTEPGYVTKSTNHINGNYHVDDLNKNFMMSPLELDSHMQTPAWDVPGAFSYM